MGEGRLGSMMDRERLRIVRVVEELEALRLRGARPVLDLQAGPGRSGPLRAFQVGGSWGGPDETVWFRARLDLGPAVPDAWPVIVVDPGWVGEGFTEGAECLLFADGKPLQAVDRHHGEVRLDPAGLGDDSVVEIEAYSGLASGPHRLARFETAWVHIPTDDLARRLSLILEAMDLVPQGPALRELALAAIGELGLAIGSSDPSLLDPALAAARACLDAGLRRIPSVHPGRVIGIGHAHIDVAWLWQLRHTRRKAVRTAATALKLMTEDPTFHFTQSQAELYAMVREEDPEFFQRIQAAVRRGSWEPVGGMWVESDTQLLTGESLVRQILLGSRFMREELGGFTPVMWLPDTFGYAASLPQIIRKSGLRGLVTSKISWNDTTRFPADSFLWQGIDGTWVPVHFLSAMPPTGEWATYNAEMGPRSVLSALARHRQQSLLPAVAIAYGYGDGGGGPTREMVARGRELNTLPSLPVYTPGTVRELWEGVEASAARLPRHVGELYLEYHRGVYTTQGRTKARNTWAEQALRRAEFLLALARSLGCAASPSDHDALQSAWRLLLRGQFHDVLPGSGIGPVYADHARDMEELHRVAEDLSRQALTALEPGPGVLLAVNLESAPRCELVALPPGYDGLVDPAGTPVDTQLLPDGRTLAALHLPGASAVGFTRAQAHPAPPGPLQVSPSRLANAHVEVELDAGRVVGLLDRHTGRQLIPPGELANDLVLYQDLPGTFDAWEIEPPAACAARHLGPADEVTVRETGPLRAVVRARWHFGASWIEEDITLTRDAPRLDFVTRLHFAEHHALLRALFPVRVLAQRATAEIPYGQVSRPTHGLRPADAAMYEVPCLHYIDLSQGDRGVALLSDVRRGYSAQGHVLGISLVRGPTSPDPDADQGEHAFTYALMAHGEGPLLGGAFDAAQALKSPVSLLLCPGAAPRTLAPLRLAATSVRLEWVKPAETGDGIVLRLVERGGRTDTATLSLAFPAAAVEEVDLLEAHPRALPQDPSGTITLDLDPYEIRTLRILPRSHRGG